VVLTCFVGLDAEELFAVVPLIQRACFVQALVALQADEIELCRCRDGLGELGLPDARRALDQQRLSQPVGEVHRRADTTIGDVLRFSELVDDVVDRRETPFAHVQADYQDAP
jgi:hypothetical protein